MQSLVKKQSAKVGLPPGTMVHIGAHRLERAQTRAMIYDRQRVIEHDVANVTEVLAAVNAPGVTWIDVDGLHDVNLIAQIGHHFGLHPLVLEDIVNTGQRSKVQDYGTYIFIVLKMLYYDEHEDEIESDQISIIIGHNFVLSFSEQVGDEFAAVREQVRDETSRLRENGADYLAYRLLDSIVDGYFAILERMGQRVEELEDRLLGNVAERGFLEELHNIKRQLLFMRAAVMPVKSLMERMASMQSPLLDERLKVYWNDVCDHTLNVMESIYTLYDMGAGNLDVYLSSIQYRQNDVMRFLTIIATIFLPLTFLVGVWGMNFEHMPEIPWRWGYPASWALMAAVAVGMLLWFKKKRWL